MVGLIYSKKDDQSSTITMLNDTLRVLSKVTENLPIGTNLGLLHFLWMLVSGALLPTRGALFPALKSIGLSDDATRRAWAAFGQGKWQIKPLVGIWRGYVKGLVGWTAHRVEGYMPVTVDVTAFWRPTLKTAPSKHYHPAAQRALPAVIIGLAGEVGDIHGQRLALPRTIERVHPCDGREARLWTDLLKAVGKGLDDSEIVVVDAGVKISDLQSARIKQYVVRLATNFTARRNYLPDHARGRKPTYGAIVRPLARQHKGKTKPATAPDEVATWELNGRPIRVEIWRDLVLPKTVPNNDNLTFDVYAFHDPAFKHPWLLATPLKLRFESVHAIYSDRWPVEQIPLSAKQMLGAHRQFVHTPESVQRLPELALLAGSMVSFLAATVPPLPSGFWDRHPQRTPGRFRRALFGHPFPKDALPSGQLRQKRSITDHLPKGVLARRPQMPNNVPFSTPLTI
jgi:hypothetical protein